jgi:hypothetical protein
MARQTSLVEVNKFVAGLITEATPLNFPDNASIDEDNFVLNTDGSRERRLGMDYEDDFIEVATTVAPPDTGDVGVSSARWRNAGGDAAKNLIAVQIGNELRIFDMDVTPLSAGVLYTKTYTDVSLQAVFSYAVVDGQMTVATGLREISTFTYTNGVVTELTGSLLIRDLFGVEDIIAGKDIRSGSGISIRPTTLPDTHLYNLRNQTWGLPRLNYYVGTPVQDPITVFFSYKTQNVYPSNSDSVIDALFANTTYTADPASLMFNPNSLISNPVGSFSAPQGFFIIDAMRRGSSRFDEYAQVRANNPALNYPLTSLPADTTPGGPTVLCEYSGRVWYSGFSGQIIDGDANSPRMASYVLFSQLIQDPSDVYSCYQDGDPTSESAPDLLDNDGGFIRLEGAYGICGMVNVGKAIMVIAANGVWQITGGSDYGFKATNYLVNKLTNHGSTSPGSIVVVDNTFMYWGDDGIYNVAPNQFGDYNAENIAKKTIQTYYDGINALDKVACKGIYDSYERKIRWVYSNRLTSGANAKELVLDIALSAFYPSTLSSFDTSYLPLLTSGVQVPAFTLTSVNDNVTANLSPVTVDGVNVTVEVVTQKPTTKETTYIIITEVSPYIKFTFGNYQNSNFRDWVKKDSVGIDAEAYILTGWMAGADAQRIKQVPYITFHFLKTEDGFEVDTNGDFIPTNQSSCLVQAQWDWSNSATSGRWGKQFQAYRFKRHYMVSDITDPYNNGYYTVDTKNKLRGKGKVLSLLMNTEPGKNCKLLGWSMILEVNQNV